MEPSDLTVSAIGIGEPQLALALAAVGFDIAVQPFAAITVGGPQFSGVEFIQIGRPPLAIISSAGDSPARAGHAIRIEELLKPEQDWSGWSEEDDEEAILTILLLMVADDRAKAAAIVSAMLALNGVLFNEKRTDA